MSREYLYGRPPAPQRAVPWSRVPERRGIADSGRIVKLLVGHGYGFIRLSDDRDIYFHRSDVQAGTSINEFVVGDRVAFDRLDDHVSGARALSVRHDTRVR